MFSLQVKKLNENAKLPKRATSHSAGYDLYSSEGGIIKARGKIIVPTGISVRFPKIESAPMMSVFGSIRSRSGWSAKHNIETGAGVIDYDYDGEIKVILYNHSDLDFEFEKHTRVAQLILTPYISVGVEEVDETDAIENNERGGGFGSTGII